jgi:hypothetical protein
MSYINLNEKELTALAGLPPLYFQLYVMGLKSAMDYRTGMVGASANGFISWQTLVKKLTPKRCKGGLYIVPTVAQIKRGINALAKRELLEKKSTKDHLIFYLKSAFRKDPQKTPLNDPPNVSTVADVARAPANDETGKRPPKRQTTGPNLIDINKEKKKDIPKGISKKEKSAPCNVALVFEHWRAVMKHPGAKLDEKRRQLIQKQLAAGYSAKELMDAISGCAVTPFNMGQNDRGEVYDGLHLILRDAERVERFIANFMDPPRGKNKFQTNTEVLREWAAEKMGGIEYAAL